MKINREPVSSGERKRLKSFLFDNICKNTYLEIIGAAEGDCPVLQISINNEYSGACETLLEYSRTTY